MSLSNTADYALRAVIMLGRSFGAGVLHADEIARANIARIVTARSYCD